MTVQSQMLSQLKKLATNGMLPHALLLHGSVDISEVDSLVVDVASKLMSLPPDKQKRAASLFLNSGHPDFLYITSTIGSATSKQKPQTLSKFGSIKIDQVKQISPFLVPAAPFEAEARVIYIKFADTLTISAQNQILKVLEEPPKDTYFILYSPKKRSILQTILSRTIHIHLPSQNSEEPSLFGLSSSRLAQTVLKQFSSEEIESIGNKVSELSETVASAKTPLSTLHIVTTFLHKILVSISLPSTVEKGEISQFSNQLLKLILLMFAQKIAFRYNRASLGIIDLLQQPQLISNNAMIFTAASLIGRELKERR